MGGEIQELRRPHPGPYGDKAGAQPIMSDAAAMQVQLSGGMAAVSSGGATFNPAANPFASV